uniref:hypothetical protein n=1 Tax=Nonomuraea lactucae TaxID=2249762 RepID=UPI0013B36A77
RSAASALRRAGAAAVVTLVIARLVDPVRDPAGARDWARASAEPFRFDRCCLCDTAPSRLGRTVR